MHFVSKWGPHAARVVLGLVFFVFGLNHFVPFMPAPPPPPQNAMAFLGGLMSTGYMLPMIKAVEVVAGLALLSNRFVPLALTLLAPIVVNIAAFHFLIVPAYPLTALILALELYLAWVHRAAFAPMLRARTPLVGDAQEAAGPLRTAAASSR